MDSPSAYLSDNNVDYVTTTWTTGDTSLTAVMPPTIDVRVLFEFRFEAVSTSTVYTDDIKVKYFDCRNDVIKPPSITAE